MKGILNKRRIGIILIIFLLAILTTSIGSYIYMRNRIYSPIQEEITTEIQKNINEEIKYNEEKGVTNILLIGTDGRSLKEAARSDSIIIATVDGRSQKIKFTSIMRDTYVKIPNHGEQKINAAFAYGGAELLMRTIKDNFGFSLDKYIVVNFQGFEDIIDAMGGLEIDVKKYEIAEINKYIGEIRQNKSPKLTKEGVQKLDGQQALAYSRIRKVGNGSYERSERQRVVLTEIFQKAKGISPLKYTLVANALLKNVKTNIEPSNLFNYGYTYYKFENPKYEQLQIPVNELSEDRIYGDKGWVILTDTEQNGQILKNFIFEDKTPDKGTFNYTSFKNAMKVYRNKESN